MLARCGLDLLLGLVAIVVQSLVDVRDQPFGSFFAHAIGGLALVVAVRGGRVGSVGRRTPHAFSPLPMESSPWGVDIPRHHLGNIPAHEVAGAHLESVRRAVAAGLSATQVLVASTSGAAELCGLHDVTGRVAPGLAADLVVLDGDPLQLTGQRVRQVWQVWRHGDRLVDAW